MKIHICIELNMWYILDGKIWSRGDNMNVEIHIDYTDINVNNMPI